MPRVVVVTGAANGIGAAVAASFASAGDEVVGFDLAEPEQPHAGVRYERVNVSDPDAVAAGFAGLARVDVLVNNAGIQRVGLVGRQPLQEWQAVIATNLNGPYYCGAEAVRRMPEGGAIVSIASTAAFVGMPGRAAYSTAKAGILGMTRVMAVELAPRRVKVNAVCPGFTRTAFVQQGIDDGSLDLDWMMQRVPYRRMAEPEEIADAVAFLAGERASYVTGQALVVDGGWTVQGINEAPDWLASS
jgi:NAD(P)-dependent dehydrogenase (short-subunit alcohol dehydrogenase family)